MLGFKLISTGTPVQEWIIPRPHNAQLQGDHLRSVHEGAFEYLELTGSMNKPNHASQMDAIDIYNFIMSKGPEGFEEWLATIIRDGTSWKDKIDELKEAIKNREQEITDKSEIIDKLEIEALGYHTTIKDLRLQLKLLDDPPEEKT